MARAAAQKQSAHDDDPSMIIAKEISILQSPIDVTIEYVDTEDRASIRGIQVRKFDGFYIGAFCLMRGAYRTFRVDRVRSAYDADGEFLADFPLFLHVHFGNSDLVDDAKARQRYWRLVERTVAPELLLLKILAGSDGRLVPAERDVIAEHAFSLVARREIPEERAELLKYVQRLSATRETVARAMQHMGEQSRARRRRFGEAALRLVQADNEIAEEELAILRLLEDSGLFG